MNLGQAAAVCLYEIAARAFPGSDEVAEAPSPPNAADRDAPHPAPPAAASGQLDLLGGLIDEVMIAAHYSPPKMQPANRHSVRLLLRRLHLDTADTRLILGLFRRILWRLRRSEAGNVTKR